MKILILGANGMLGQDLVSEMSSVAEVTAYDKEDLDICEFQQANKKVAEIKPDVIINAAAYTNVDGAETEFAVAEKINGDALKNLTRAAYDNVATLIHFSTEMVFAGDRESGYNENDAPNPVNKYGLSKFKGEQYLLEWAENYPDFKYLLVRTSWLYGKNPQAGKPRDKNFVDTILEKVGHDETVKVVNDQLGKPTYTLDLAAGVKRMITEKTENGIYHLVNEGVTSWYELARQACLIKYNNDALITSCSSADYPRQANRPKYGILNNTKFSKLRSWRLALEDYLD